MIAGKWPAAGIGSVQTRCQSHYQQIRLFNTERGYWRAEIVGVHASQLSQVRREPRAPHANRIMDSAMGIHSVNIRLRSVFHCVYNQESANKRHINNIKIII